MLPNRCSHVGFEPALGKQEKVETVTRPRVITLRHHSYVMTSCMYVQPGLQQVSLLSLTLSLVVCVCVCSPDVILCG